MKPSEQRKQSYWIWQEYERTGSLEYLEEAVLEDPSFLHPQTIHQSLLEWAINSSDVEAVKLLVRLGADVNAPQYGGYTYLHSAIECKDGPASIFEILLNSGADPTVNGICGRNALHHAAMFGRTDAIPALFSHGADINSKTDGDNSTTPLMEAARAGYVDVVSSLLKLGADRSITDQMDMGGEGGGRTAVDFALQYNHHEIAEFLKAAE